MRKARPPVFKGRHFEPEIIMLCVRRYLRFSLSYRNLEELVAERNLAVDHVTIWNWVQRYAPELDRRCRRELRMTNRSWRVDETYVRIAGTWTHLYRAVDSVGDTIDFLLSPNRDAQAAKRFFHKALHWLNHPRSRVINVDGTRHIRRSLPNPGVPENWADAAGAGPFRYLSSIVEQDHRAIKRRVRASQEFRSFESAWRTIQGIETVNMIRKGQVRSLPKDDILGHALFIAALFGVSMTA
jgi:transposase-like protein